MLQSVANFQCAGVIAFGLRLREQDLQPLDFRQNFRIGNLPFNGFGGLRIDRGSLFFKGANVGSSFDFQRLQLRGGIGCLYRRGIRLSEYHSCREQCQTN